MLRGEPRGGKRPPSCGLPSASARRIPRFRLAGSVPGRLLRCFRSGAFCIRRPSGTVLPRRISVRFGFGSGVRSFRRLFSPDSPPSCLGMITVPADPFHGAFSRRLRMLVSGLSGRPHAVSAVPVPGPTSSVRLRMASLVLSVRPRFVRHRFEAPFPAARSPLPPPGNG